LIARYTGDPADRIPGTCFHISEQELAATDRYEVDAYQRTEAELESGARAFVYVANPAISERFHRVGGKLDVPEAE
jgi:gamma-glutamylcyclotransferase (GGCT)/AIG2-like uncharacterized protein YtfP